MARTILLDVDGVLCNFIDGIIKSKGLDITHDEWVNWNHHRYLGMTDEEFWDITRSPEWWLNLQPYPWASDLILVFNDLFDVVYCTSPSLDSSCPSQKVEWLRRQGFMSNSRNDYVIAPKKELLARPDAILIDDSHENCDKFRLAGGKAIVFPQPWNSVEVDGKNDDKVEYIIQRVKTVL